MNNNQFRISIEQHITNMYNSSYDSFLQANGNLQNNPRSQTAKIDYHRYLAEKQTLEALLHHIEKGSYDSEEYYTMYLNPKTRFKK